MELDFHSFSIVFPQFIHTLNTLWNTLVFSSDNASDTKGSLIQKTAEATRYPFATVRRVLGEANQGKEPTTVGKKRPNRKEALSKVDDFD